MKIINSQSLSNVNISSLATVYSYTITETLLVVIDIILDGVSANADYDFQFFSDNAMILPSRNIPIPAGVTKANIQSRSLMVRANTALTLKISGAPSDTSVNILVNLINASPIEADDVVTTIEPGVTDAITEGLAQTEIRPTRTILGPCRVEDCEDE